MELGDKLGNVVNLRDIGEGLSPSYDKMDKVVYETPKYKLIKPIFCKSYTTTVSATSQKR
ncbi:MAG: hypothetical protein PF542_00840 [Nanoarchaeota archaeon]|jgi:hypothetical protein|nr:hypothetical protein [Nanoarchaeota archaeon]